MSIVGGAEHSDDSSRIVMKTNVKNFIISTSMENLLKPWEWTEQTIQRYNPQANIPLCMEVICELIFEYYGLNPREYRNEKKMEKIQMAQHHKNTIDKRYDVNSKIAEFVGSKYGDEYKKTHGVSLETDNETSVVTVPNHMVMQDLSHFQIKTGVEPEQLA